MNLSWWIRIGSQMFPEEEAEGESDYSGMDGEALGAAVRPPDVCEQSERQ